MREISPVQEMAESQAIHAKDASDNTDVHASYAKSLADEQHEQTPEQSQRAIQFYQNNTAQTDKLSLGKVKDIMSQPVIQIFDDQSLESAWQLMQENGIHHLIILNDAYHYTGLLSEKRHDPLPDALRQKPANDSARQPAFIIFL